MNEPTMDKLMLRLDRLERENRRLKTIGSISVVILSVFLLIGATQGEKIIIADTVKAKKFMLLAPDDGKPIGFWSGEGSKNDRASLIFVDKELNTLLHLTASPVPRLQLGRSRWGGTSYIEANRERTARIVLYDKDRNKRAVLGGTSLETTSTGTEIKTAESSLVLFDKKGKVIWKAP